MRFHARRYIALFSVLLLSYALASARTNGRPDAPPSEERLISLDLQNATITDIVTALGQKYGVNIVCETYSDDMPLGHISIPGIPLRHALPKLAELFDRKMQIVNGVVVWRHRKWFARAVQEKYSAEHYHITWGSMAWHRRPSLTIRRMDETASIATPRTATQKPSSEHSSKTPATEDLLPAQWLSIQAQAVLVTKVMSEFSTHSGWLVTTETALRERRISMQLKRVTPGQAIEALTALLNARQKVTIEQSEVQRKEEALLAENAADQRNDRAKLSDKLKQALLDQMTQQQREALQNGLAASFNVNALPPDLQKLALAYVDLAAADMRQRVASFAALDPQCGFTLVIRPEAFLAISIYGYDTNGGRVGF